MKKSLPKDWISHLIPFATILIAVAMLLLTPFWAYQGYNEPFLGMLIEPNNVVSQINGKGWPARQQGVEWSDRLIAIDGQKVNTPTEQRAVLEKTGFASVETTFEKRSGEKYTLNLTPKTIFR